MKKFCLILFSTVAVLSCKKEEKLLESTVVETNQAEIATNEVATLAVAPDLGKTIFTQEGRAVIAFDSRSQKGEVVVNGKPYTLNNIEFSENSYRLSGDDVSISAENGDFGDVESDCAYGEFPSVRIVAGGAQVQLRNVKVQDCPEL